MKPRHDDEPIEGYERDVAARAIKRLADGLWADLWLGVDTNPDADHVWVSDDPDLAFALDVLPGAGIGAYADVVRVGVDATRYQVEVDSRPKDSRGSIRARSSF